MEWLFTWRHRIALSVTGVLLAVILIGWFTGVNFMPEPKPLPQGPEIMISLGAPPEPTPPEPEPPPPPPPEDMPLEPDRPREPIKPRPPRPPQPQRPPTPQAVQPPTNTPAAAAPTTQQAVDPIRVMEAAYIAAVRAQLEAIKRYPTSKEARLQRPKGDVTIWFVLSRSGEVIDSGIEQSAGSILDRGAQTALTRAKFPPFPAEAWRGQQTHRFTAKIGFTPG
ncbi:MAG: TonB family protein [Alphaproteobacteria bacterium]|nr:TonB family protein [Alphaproteobacteria bacterium]